MSERHSTIFTARRIIINLVVLGAILSVVTALCNSYGLRLLRRLNSYNPMQLSFLVDFEVVNESGIDVELIPIGMLAVTGEYAPLPRFDGSSPGAMPVDSSRSLPIVAGATITVVYDYDDINSRHILIRDRSGGCYIVDTDKRGTKHACYGPQKERYTIPPVRELRPAPRELLPCFNGTKVSYSGAREYP